MKQRSKPRQYTRIINPLPLKFMEKSGEDNKTGNKAVPENQQNSKTRPVNSTENTAEQSRANSPESENKNQDNPQTDPGASINDDSSIQNFSTSSKTEMEVHHHPHLGHKSKPFKEYLLEGFMIFIAVMMGFIAENIRERITDKEHVHQLSSQLAQDLKADTATLNKIYKEETYILKNDDSLIVLLQQPLLNTITRRIQKLIANSHSMWPFHPSSGAIDAIKNELHLKQFSNSAIISYIAKYEGHIDLLHTVQDITLQYQRSYLDPFMTSHFTPSNLMASFTKDSVPETQMRNVTQQDLTQLNADMVLIRINTRELVDDNRLVNNDAVSLLQYVTKQYQLEDE